MTYCAAPLSDEHGVRAQEEEEEEEETTSSPSDASMITDGYKALCRPSEVLGAPLRANSYVTRLIPSRGLSQNELNARSSVGEVKFGMTYRFCLLPR